MHNLYLKIKTGKYTTQSLVHYGILLQNNQINSVTFDIECTEPYYVIDEGIIFNPELCNKIRKSDNVEVYKRGALVFKKVSNSSKIEVFFDVMVYDLYEDMDREFVYDIINNYEHSRKIYSTNTEDLPIVPNCKSISGLASGWFLAELAYKANATNVVYFDYSQESLDFQRELIDSGNRLETFKQNLTRLTVGHRDTTIDDLNQLNMDSINLYYDYLKTVKTEFLLIDMRNTSDLNNLVNSLPEGTYLWISNVFHYVTSINDYDYHRYIYLDKLCNDRNIKLLPYTRVYENKNNI